MIQSEMIVKTNMIVANKITGKDVSSLFLQQMQGKITRDDFIKLSGLDPKIEKNYEN